MVFGFNSEVNHEGTVYHVQSEVRNAERRLDTQVFVAGRCVGRLARPFASPPAVIEVADDPPANEGTLSEENIHDRLKEQHREVLAAIRTGGLDKLLAQSQPALEWLGVQTRSQAKTMVLRFRVDPAPVRVIARLESEGLATVAEAESSPDGIVELEFPFDSPRALEASLVIQTDAAGRNATQRFRLHRK